MSGGGVGPPRLLQVPEGAYALALAALPGAGPATLSAVLAAVPPSEAWAAVREGRLQRPVAHRARAGSDPTWQELARRGDVAGWWRRACRAGVEVTWAADHRYPGAFCDDPEPPGVLFWRGELGALERPCVAVVGTRHATPDGRKVAFELGRDLAAAGVCVVSGLALGIDGSAHRGALADGGTTVGVAASGPDVVYPRRHADLWEEVVRAGAIVSETPPGWAAQAWRFPSRNRLIAGLTSFVVIVESREAGGSMHTVDAALRRGMDVGTVPGPVHSPASAGTNRLLCDGATPIRSAADVLDALGLGALDLGAGQPAMGRHRATAQHSATGRHPAAGDGTDQQPAAVRCPERHDAGVAPTGAARLVLDALGWTPTQLGRLVERTGLPIAAVNEALDRLEVDRWVDRQEGWWMRRA